ncbi:hypothetical protein ABQX22_05935 [Xanthomonas sp. WHRI 1810A]|uniref:hypothetical protein n=1 Tax=Xanthomonas sp. WHRI 1810A TaxID=3161565 RepID=UPI0032E8A23E
MTRLTLSFFCALSIGAYSVCALAAGTSSAGQDTRAQVEAKRDQISGVDKVTTPTAKANASSALLDAPVDTGDAPAQVQKP